MTWNYDMQSAPKGTVKRVKLPKGKQGFREITLKVPILISTKDEVVLSTWSKGRDQWSGIATDQIAIAWMPWPDPAP